jgi:hypothetical protein
MLCFTNLVLNNSSLDLKKKKKKSPQGWKDGSAVQSIAVGIAVGIAVDIAVDIAVGIAAAFERAGKKLYE